MCPGTSVLVGRHDCQKISAIRLKNVLLLKTMTGKGWIRSAFVNGTMTDESCGTDTKYLRTEDGQTILRPFTIL